MGRKPHFKIDWEQFDGLCGIQCTLSEIAAFFGCSEDTIENYVKRYKKCLFSEYFERKRGLGKVSLRRRQFRAAQDGNVTMLIWLGKQYLGQADYEEERVDLPASPYNVAPETPEQARQTKLEIIKAIFLERNKNVVQITESKDDDSGRQNEAPREVSLPGFTGKQSVG